MNDTYYDNFTFGTNQNMYTPSPIIIQDTNNLISSISLAVCSILLSVTGVIVALQKSRCVNVKCGKLKIQREVVDV